jgi:hypothetical protein
MIIQQRVKFHGNSSEHQSGSCSIVRAEHINVLFQSFHNVGIDNNMVACRRIFMCTNTKRMKIGVEGIRWSSDCTIQYDYVYGSIMDQCEGLTSVLVVSSSAMEARASLVSSTPLSAVPGLGVSTSLIGALVVAMLPLSPEWPRMRTAASR